MNNLQKLILGVLAVANVIVLGGALWLFSSMRSPTSGELPTLLPTRTPTPRLLGPTWTPTPSPTPSPTFPPEPTNTPRPTRTPYPTATHTVTPTPEPVELDNSEFDMLMPNRIPGWEWYADVNYRPGDDYYPHQSYAEPVFEAADDPARRINGSTLKIETVRWLKFRAYVHQSITVTAGSSVSFRVKANAFSSIEKLILRAGVDPLGRDDCENARWGEAIINQDDGIVTIQSPWVVVGDRGRVTVCIYAEPRYPDTNNAAFFDQAEIIVR